MSKNAAQQVEQYEVSEKDTEGYPCVIVGTGPVGMRVARELLQRDPKKNLIIYGNEPWDPYNRVRLTSWLAGELSWKSMINQLEIPDGANVVLREHCPVKEIVPREKYIVDEDGRTQFYSFLVLATGSEPHIPNIPGVDYKGVYTFRNMNDACFLAERRSRAKHVLVVGGGLLGLEAARAMKTAQNSVTVIDHNVRLMNRQLDDVSSDMLQQCIAEHDIDVMLGVSIKTILGDGAVCGVQLSDGQRVDCDTIILATGIRPSTRLALDSGLAIGRGIRVNDQMQTTDPWIYAVGECVEHRDRIYGLVAPGFEQAAVAAHSICGHTSKYTGSINASKLKVVGKTVFSMGEVGEEEYSLNNREVVYKDAAQNIYRKLILKRNRLTGVIVYGEWSELGRVQQSVGEHALIFPWQLRRFRNNGHIWNKDNQDRVSSWPANTTICNCTGVTRGSISGAISAGCLTVDEISAKTGASAVCGSCKPLVQQLLSEADVKQESAPVFGTLAAVSLIALIAALLMYTLNPVPYVDSVQTWQWDQFWTDGLWKQISGFSLLGFGLVALLLSLRKRWAIFNFWDYKYWRLLHAAVGLICIFLLVFHTGLHLGMNLNLWLMVSFLGTVLLGGIAGFVNSIAGKLPATTGAKVQTMTNWAHLVLSWPLPTLLGFHIVSVYYF